MDQRLDREKHRLAIEAEKMKRVSPLEKLSQGFSYTQDENGNVYRTDRETGPGQRIGNLCKRRNDRSGCCFRPLGSYTAEQ